MATLPTPDGSARGIRPVVAVGAGGRRRRPSGEPPPLPRSLERRTSAAALLTLAALALAVGLTIGPVLRVVTAVDVTLLRGLARLRADVLTEAADRVVLLGSPGVVRAVAWATLAVLVITRRWRHLVVFLLVTLGATLLVAELTLVVGRPRPTDVEVLGDWQGYAFPSRPVAAATLVAVAALCTVVPAGRARTRAALAAAGALAVLTVARLYLAVDHPSDILAAGVLGGLLPLAAFRLLTPDEVFPVTYRRGSGAHLELSAARQAAIVRAFEQQLGLSVAAIEPYGLGGSAGSTPLRIEVTGEGGRTVLLGKLYAVTHLRSDRWYKLARTVLYGRLEDEKPFSTVRRLVEYEDHMLRLLRDSGLPTPAPHGFVEITPEREYVVVMEFLAGAREVGEEPVGEREIDSGLRVVRKLWEAGVAHRDLKPSNLLVRDGQVLLIDVAFATVRPTPWRQAVDLATMMLTLALGSSAELVYERALRQFAAEDIAEAFAASRSVTVPTQLRSRLRADGRDLPAAFRRLAPRRPPVAIQLWSVRRVAVTAAVLLAALLGGGLVVSYARVVGSSSSTSVQPAVPRCGQPTRQALVAQSVPSAAYVPCLRTVAAGWTVTRFVSRTGGTEVSLLSDRAQGRAVVARYRRRCDVRGATPEPPRSVGGRSYLRLDQISPRYTGRWYDVFAGGCVTYDVDFERGPHIGLMDQLLGMVDLVPRRELRLQVRAELGQDLRP